MKYVNKELLDQVSLKAKKSARKRMNHNFHKDGSELLQRMLNALEPETYLAPHRHTSQIEIFLLLRGRIRVVLFDDNGTVTESKVLNPNDGKYGVEIPVGVWHTILVEESGSVIYEIKEGPYVPNVGIEFAPWAPDPLECNTCMMYLEQLRQQVR